MKLSAFFLALFCLCTFSACDNRADKSKDWEVTLEFKDQVLDPGSNTLQLDLAETSKSFAEKNGMDPKAIQSVNLLSCEILLEDGNNFDDIEDVVFQLTSNSSTMKQLAIFSNKEKGKTSLSLGIAKDNDAGELFATEKVIAVVEVGANEGGTKSYKFKAKCKFKFTSKQQS